MKLVRVLAWVSLLFIAYATLVPIGLRPHLSSDPQVEHVAAFEVVGFLFGVAYPRHMLLVAAVVFCSAIALEALQLVDPGRHGRWWDVTLKLAGGAIGLLIGWGAPKKPGARHGHPSRVE